MLSDGNGTIATLTETRNKYHKSSIILEFRNYVPYDIFAEKEHERVYVLPKGLSYHRAAGLRQRSPKIRALSILSRISPQKGGDPLTVCSLTHVYFIISSRLASKFNYDALIFNIYCNWLWIEKVVCS